MIGKVGRPRTSAKGGDSKSRFADIVKYITRDDNDKEINPADIGVCNLPLEDPAEMALNIDMMDIAAKKTQTNGKFKGDPVYHLVLSWREEDSPTRKQVADCVEYTLKSLGMEECQAVWAIHRDTDDDHVHIAVNRVHPTKGIVVGPPRYDYFKIDKAMRELEIRHGFSRDNGPFVTLDTDKGPKIVRMSRKERAEKGLLRRGGDDNDLEPAPALTQAARAAERNQGAESFQSWARGEPAKALKEALESPDASWQGLHEAAARFGMTIQTKGTGMVVTTEAENGRILACPLSKLDRNLTRMRLEQRLGEFAPPSPDASGKPQAKPAERTYTEYLRDAQACGSQEGPAAYDDPDDKDNRRAGRRAERQQAREDLHRRYQEDQQRVKEHRHGLRASLKRQHQAEQEALNQSLRERKGAFIAGKMASSGMDRQMAAGLWAYQAAREREALKKRQQKARNGLPKTLVWRDWLEKQAALEPPDEAALAALRGIRYRERRDGTREKNGFEGEELDDLKPLLAKIRAETDRRRNLIRYRDEQGKVLFVDSGPRIDVLDKSSQTMEAALQVAAQKYGALDITGSAAFREQAARTAARLGIRVRDADLRVVWQQERERKTPAWSPAPETGRSAQQQKE